MIWLLNGHKAVQKKETAPDTMRSCSGSFLQKASVQWFTLIFLESSHKLAKIWRGIMTNPPHIDPTQNGVAEREVRRVKEGTSTLSVQSGLVEQWWSEAMQCYFYLRNIHVFQHMGRLRTKEDTRLYCVGQRYLLDHRFFYHPISTKDTNFIDSTPDVFEGILIRCALNAGSGWTGDPLIADAKALKDHTASEVSVRKIQKKRSGNPTSRRTIHTSRCWRFIKITRRSTSSHLQTESISSEIWWKISVDAPSQKKMMGQTLQKNKKTPRMWDAIPGAYLQPKFIDIKSWTVKIVCVCASRRIISWTIKVQCCHQDTLRRIFDIKQEHTNR